MTEQVRILETKLSRADVYDCTCIIHVLTFDNVYGTYRAYEIFRALLTATRLSVIELAQQTIEKGVLLDIRSSKNVFPNVPVSQWASNTLSLRDVPYQESAS